MEKRSLQKYKNIDDNSESHRFSSVFLSLIEKFKGKTKETIYYIQSKNNKTTVDITWQGNVRKRK